MTVESTTSIPILQCKQNQVPVFVESKVLDDEELSKLEQFRAMEPWKAAFNEPKDDCVRNKEFDVYIEDTADVDDEYWQSYFRDFCNDACLLRYLRANNWQVEDAYRCLVLTLQWRKHYRPHFIRPEQVYENASCGKVYLNGFDKEGRCILYLRNHLESSNDHAMNIRHLLFQTEKAIQLMDQAGQGAEKLVLIFDFSKYSASNSVPMHVAKHFLHLFATHYPERLGVMFACEAPWYFSMFYKLISPFIHPVTKSKIRFVQISQMEKISPDQESTSIWANILNYVDKDTLEVEFRGDFDFKYDHQLYWKSLLDATCSQQG
ncbi:hypothetical protein MIR68_003630 [Amoeboaphelidium protococcarum]|nr:hypothetical protein MIR68_003630 [Amoeboaphelidium protococcarum]